MEHLTDEELIEKIGQSADIEELSELARELEIREELRLQEMGYYSEEAIAERERERLAREAEEKRKKAEKKAKMKRVAAFFFQDKNIEIGYSSKDLMRLQAEKAAELLTEKAFSQVRLYPVKDIFPGSRMPVGAIQSIAIGGRNVFWYADRFPYDIPIVIYYHDKVEVTIPVAAGVLKGTNYQQTYQWLQRLGFTNIHLVQKRDVWFGLFHADGEVESVTIASSENFNAYSTYKFDAEVVITYHTSSK